MPRKTLARDVPHAPKGAYAKRGRPDNATRLARHASEVARDTAPSLICLGGGVESLEIIKQVKALGYRPIVMSPYNVPAEEWVKSFPKFKYGSGHQQDALFWGADVYDYNRVFATIRGKLSKISAIEDGVLFDMGNVKGIMCCAVDSPLVQAQIAERYHWPTIGVEAAKFGVNKYWQWKVLSSHGVPVPPTKVVNAEMSYDALSDYDLVKPVDSRGARGVMRIDATNYKQAIVEATSYSRLASCIAQQWIEGVQLSTESVLWHDQDNNPDIMMTAIARRNYDRLDQFYPMVIEDGSDSPAGLSNDEVQRVNDVLLKSCKALGWRDCTVKGDVIIDEYGQVWVIELACRMSGGYFASHIIPIGMGWNFIKDAVQIAIGQKPILEFNHRNYTVCQRFVFPKPEWIGHRIKSLPTLDGVFHTWNFKPGDIVREVKSHPDRLGQCIILNGNASEWIEWLTEGIQVE